MRTTSILFSLIFSIILLFTMPLSAQEETQSVPFFKDGQAQIVIGFSNPEEWIREDLWVETTFDSDGDGKLDRMHVDVTRPIQTDSDSLKLPIIYNTSPYFCGTAGGNSEYLYDVHHELGETPTQYTYPSEIVMNCERPIISNAHVKTWLPYGYIVVHSSSPGTGLSDGSPTVGGDNESLAPQAVIEWLCGQRKGYTSREGIEEVEAYWSNGKVGMTGTSYNGTLPLAAATTGVEGLEVIIPVSPNTSYYHYYRSNGLIRSPGGYLGEDIDVLFDFIHSSYDQDKRAYARENIRDGEMKNGMDRINGDYNDFWAGRDYLNDMEPMNCAMLMSHGFNDWNVMPEHSYRIYKAAQEKGLETAIYYHQRGHGGPPPFEMMNRWFSHYLFEVDNGVETEENRAWIVREEDKIDNPTPYVDFPNPAAEPVTFHLGGGAPQHGLLSTDELPAQQNEVITDNYSFSGESLAQAEYTNHRLAFVTPILKEDIHISGVPTITIEAASSKPAVNLSVYLVSLPWNSGRRMKITDNIITRGWADLQNHKTIRKSKPLKEGKFYEMTFYLQPDDQVIKAGQQIGLIIFCSDRNFTLLPEPGTTLEVNLNNTTLHIPIVGGVEAFKQATE